MKRLGLSHGTTGQVHETITASATISATITMKSAAASILDYTDQITRATLPALGPALQPAASNVIPLAKR